MSQILDNVVILWN